MPHSNPHKKITRIHRGTGGHWVGDGFPVNTLFSYFADGGEISPFLLLDYAGPATFEPSKRPRGVELHPHRGFETVTIVVQGEVEHKDSAGNAGKIGPGDVQWMTAARGILHEEMHSREFTEHGGTLEMIQLWVNLPAKDKMSDPHYQEILSASIPVLDLPDNAGTMRIIAGEAGGIKGAAKTFTPLNLWDLRLHAGKSVELVVPSGHSAMLLVLSGEVTTDSETLKPKELAHFDRDRTSLPLTATADSHILLMGGEPILEPIAGRGPFVMNTHAEIKDAMVDYAMGRLA